MKFKKLNKKHLLQKQKIKEYKKKKVKIPYKMSLKIMNNNNYHNNNKIQSKIKLIMNN